MKNSTLLNDGNASAIEFGVRASLEVTNLFRKVTVSR